MIDISSINLLLLLEKIETFCNEHPSETNLSRHNLRNTRSILRKMNELRCIIDNKTCVCCGKSIPRMQVHHPTNKLLIAYSYTVCYTCHRALDHCIPTIANQNLLRFYRKYLRWHITLAEFSEITGFVPNGRVFNIQNSI
jgi:hypothetical protein